MENCTTSDFSDSDGAVQSPVDQSDIPDIIELHVGNCRYVTTWATVEKQEKNAVDFFRQKLMDSKSDNVLKREPAFPNASVILEFVEQDGKLFRYILEYMRNGRLVLPKNFRDHEALKKEALFYNLKQLADLIKLEEEKNWKSFNWLFSFPDKDFTQGFPANYITLSHLTGFTFARPGQSDAAFRKLHRISVCGKVSSCREVFGSYLNESRDPNCEDDNHYTARMFLKHNILELAFDQLALRGYHIVACCSSEPRYFLSTLEIDESEWSHNMEYVFGKE